MLLIKSRLNMELKKINYRSAVFFGVFALVAYFLSGLLQIILVNQFPQFQAVVGSVPKVQTMILVPLVGGVFGYVFSLFAIFIYNKVAMKHPISWVIKK